MSTPPALIVLSHLRWEFVFQRPQHLMTRLAEQYRVYFVEEPRQAAGPPRLASQQVAANLTVCVPHTPSSASGFHDDQLPVLEMLLEGLVEQDGLQDPLVWLYTPMALPLAEKLAPRVLVYDCMDELSAFLNAPRQLIQREGALLRRADLVFTGGPSLYEAKRHRHHSVHCLPSSVDEEHFARARTLPDDHPLHADIPHPRLGFYGVIDERPGEWTSMFPTRWRARPASRCEKPPSAWRIRRSPDRRTWVRRRYLSPGARCRDTASRA